MVQLLNYRSTTEDLCLYASIPEGQAREDYVHSILLLDASNYTTPSEFTNRNMYFFATPPTDKLLDEMPQLRLHNASPPTTNLPLSEVLIVLFDTLANIPEGDWAVDHIKSRIHWIIAQAVALTAQNIEDVALKADNLLSKSWSRMIHQYLRWALLAGKNGPDSSETLGVLGKQEALMRLKTAGIVFDRENKKLGRVRYT